MSRLKKISRKIYGPKNRRGATAIIVAIVLVVLLGIAALAVDIGYLYAAKNELQNAADAAALAGARQLGDIYSQLPVTEQMSYICESGDQTLIKTAAIDVALQNRAATLPVVIDADEVEIGVWESGSFEEEVNQPNAVRVTAKRDGSTGATIGTFFARVLGINEASVIADATAALTAQSTTKKGELELPIGISKFRFTTEYCNKPIKFSPTKDPDACAGWNVFTDINSSKTTLESILKGLTDGSYTSPETTAGITKFNYTGGEISAVFEDLAALLAVKSPETYGSMYFKCNDPSDAACKAGGNIGEYDSNGDWQFYNASTPGVTVVKDKDKNEIQRREWVTGTVVYDWEDCGNPNTFIKIVGYTTIKLWCVFDTHVTPNQAQNLVMGEIICDGYYDGRGGGSSSYGTKGTIPGLVE